MVRNVERHKEEQQERENRIKFITERKFQEKVQEVAKLKQISERRVGRVTIVDKELEERFEKFKQQKEREAEEEKFNKSLINRTIASKRREKRRRNNKHLYEKSN